MGKGKNPRVFAFFVALLAAAVMVPGLAAGGMRGDLDGDGQVCRTDLNIILSHRNQPADVCPECDLDGDGMITALDARKLVILCTLPRCVCADVPPNTPPVADAGADQTVFVGDTVQLDGSGSTDVDGDPLDFYWSLSAVPEGSTAELSDPNIVNPTVDVDLPGTYVAELIVNDGQVDSDPDTVTVTTQNSPPVADAGPDQTVFVGETVYLDGSLSHDVDWDVLTYQWSLTVVPEGSSAALSDPTAVDPTFDVDLPGTYVAELIVNDGQVDSDPDTVQIDTQNSPPVADAGPDQTAFAGDTVQLDGSGSYDVDLDDLSYQWSLTVKPDGSSAELSDQSIVDPTFVADLPGVYVAQLIVNDGTVDSDPDTVAITIQVNVPDVVGDLQVDAEAAIVAAGLIVGNITFENSDTVEEGRVISQNPACGALVPPATPVDLVVSLGPEMVTVPDVVGLAQAVAEQAITDAGLSVGTIDTAHSDTVPAGDVISQDPAGGMSVPRGSGVNLVVSLGPETTIVPDVVGLAQADAEAAIIGANLVVGTVTTANSDTVPAGNVISQNPAGGAAVAPGSAVDLVMSSGPALPTVPDVVGMTQADAESAIAAAGLVVGDITTRYSDTIPTGTVHSQSPVAGTPVEDGAAVDLVISLGPSGLELPPDPADVAPEIDDSVATTLFDATEFLYTGTDPIQTGVDPGTIDQQRVVVVRGKVKERNGNPLPGVTITILNHPEYGQTVTREDGMFDLAANGGDTLTVKYQLEGFLPAYRQVTVPWQDYAHCKDVVMIKLDPEVTILDLNASDPIQVAAGSVVEDEDGRRQATILIPEGTESLIFPPDGSIQPIETLSFRATEYTVGDNGPEAMPAELPATSAYTYCVELSADEALANGVKIDGKDVVFTQPIFFYLENFLELPVGVQVPIGYYVREQSAWVPAEDGRVIEIVGYDDVLGVAELDIDGDGNPESDETLDNFGIHYDERTALLDGLYEIGQTLWRVPITHFSSPDLNFGAGPSPNATASNGRIRPNSDDKIKNPSSQNGYGSIDIQNQVFRETINLTGTPYNLNYASDRVPGRMAAYSLEIPLIGDAVPDECKRIELEIRVAGRVFTQSFDADEQAPYTFEWDGMDAYGRTLQGAQKATIRVGYVYDAFYQEPPRLEQTFGLLSGIPMSTSPAREEITLWQERQTLFNLPCTWFALDQAVGGWTLNVHHAYDVSAGILHLGDGSTRSWDSGTRDAVIDASAGSGVQGYSGDGEPALEANLNEPWGVDVAADGTVYFADRNNNRIRIISPNGVIETVAGGGSGGDGSSPLDAFLNKPSGVTVRANGDFFISEYWSCRVRLVKKSAEQMSIITTVAGTGDWGYSGDDGPAVDARLSNVGGIAVALDGTLYIADTFNNRIRRVGPGGIITTVAGNGVSGFNGDGVSATEASLHWPFGVAIGPDGALYIADTYNQRIRRVGTNGIITTVAGNGVWASNGDGEAATEASISYPYDIDVGIDGDLYIAETDGQRIRLVDSEGTITTLAGTGDRGDIGDGGLPAAAMLDTPYGVASGPDGAIYICQVNNRVRKVMPTVPISPEDEFLIASRGGNCL